MMNFVTPPAKPLDETSGEISFDSSLTELRLGRRLQRVVRSIDSFLQNQLARLEDAMEHCRRVDSEGKVLQRLIAEFEDKRATWEKARLAEEQRLFESGERLIAGWQQLEQERSQQRNR